MNTLTGTIKVICDTEQISEKFSKRSLIVDIGGDTPINLEYHFDDCEKLDHFKEGESVKVEFDLDGRKWTNPQGVDKYFVTLKIANIIKEGQAPPAPAFEPPAMPDLSAQPEDDVPF
jgi:hypothetical protein